MSDYKRLAEVINFLIESRRAFNDADFASQVGTPRSFISEAKAGKKTITDKFVLKVESAFPDINGEYILTGEGSMLKPSSSDSAPYRKIVGNEVEVVPMDNYVAVPFYDLEASAGLPNGDTPAGWVETRLVPRQYAGDEYLVVRVSGDSMDDGTSRSLCHGDEIVVKRELFDPANTLPIRSKLFVVDTMEGAVIKQILECNRSEGTVTLHSFNERYRDYQVPLSEVRGFYSVQCFSLKSIRF